MLRNLPFIFLEMLCHARFIQRGGILRVIFTESNLGGVLKHRLKGSMTTVTRTNRFFFFAHSCKSQSSRYISQNEISAENVVDPVVMAAICGEGRGA